MRSPKSRSRGKSNRGRSPANNLNRVFDSSGPESKVRGTPQQIIDKYLQLSRDATLSNDRVAAENFMQHAEHYVRLLAEAQRDADEKRLQSEQQNRDRQQQQKPRERDTQDQPNVARDDRHDDRRANGRTDDDAPRRDDRSDAGDVVGDATDRTDSGLVETPEMKPKKVAVRKPRSPRPKVKTEDVASDVPSDAGE